MGCGASVPPVPAPAAPKLGPSEAAPADELGVWLRKHKLEQYEDTLRDSLGASSVADLRTMGESDWLELGLKKLEVRRVLRELEVGLKERTGRAGLIILTDCRLYARASRPLLVCRSSE